MKYFPLAIALLLSGCAPHIFKAESVTLSADNMDVTESQNLNEKCIFKTTIPKTYIMNREGYSLEFEVISRQVAFRVISVNPSISVSTNSMRPNNSFITKLSSKYLNYIPIEGAGVIEFVILNREKTIAKELLSVNFVTCKAAINDAI